MLKFMRRHAASLWIKLLFGLLAATFIYWGIGVGLQGTDRFSPAATVNGVPITEKELERAHENLVRFYRDLYGDQFRPELLQSVDTRGQALDQLIRTELLYQTGVRWGLTATDKEVRDAIAQMPAFRSEAGQFDKDFYLRVLRANRLTPGEFEESVRRDLIVRKVQDIALAGVYVSEQDARQQFLAVNEKVNLAFVEFDPHQFSREVAVDDAHVQDYYNRHRESFREPERVKVEYALYDEQTFLPRAEVTEEEIRRYYEEHESEFSTPEKVRARHILFRLEPSASAEQKQEARKRAEEALSRIRKGEDFATLAKELSQDPGSAEQGGDLGFFERGKMVAPFEAVAFSLEPGSVSEPVETTFGFHIIKVEEKLPAHTRPFDEVKATLSERLKRERARALAQIQAEQDRERVASGDSLAQVAGTSGIEVRVAGPFAQNDPIEKLGAHPLSRAAFETKVQEVGPVVRSGNHFVIFRVLERQESFVPELPAIRERVAAEARLEKARALAREKAEAFLSAAKEKGFEATAQSMQREVQETGPFTFEGGYVPHIGTLPELKKIAFALSAESPLPSQVFSSGDSFYVVAFKEKLAPDWAEFQKEKDRLIQQATNERRSEVLEKFLNGLKAEAQIRLGRVEVAAASRSSGAR